MVLNSEQGLHLYLPITLWCPLPYLRRERS